MSHKELNYSIYFEDITPRPQGGNYQLFHFGELEFLDESYPFTLIEMYDENIGYTSFELTWVEGEPEDFASKLEDAIIKEYEDKSK